MKYVRTLKMGKKFEIGNAKRFMTLQVLHAFLGQSLCFGSPLFFRARIELIVENHVPDLSNHERDIKALPITFSVLMYTLALNKVLGITSCLGELTHAE